MDPAGLVFERYHRAICDDWTMEVEVPSEDSVDYEADGEACSVNVVEIVD